MSKELAERFERDLSAPEETAERARRAREQGAALDLNWDEVFETYANQANLDPKEFIRFSDIDYSFADFSVAGSNSYQVSSDDEERYEPATPR